MPEELNGKSREENWYLSHALFTDFDQNIYNQEAGLSDIQAKAILELRLQRLTGMERDKIQNEFTDLMKLLPLKRITWR